MKKIIGILGVAVIAATMFFSANNLTGSSSDASLASLVGMNSANAETMAWGCRYTGVSGDYCSYFGSRITNCGNSSLSNCGY
jgi:hypothetical protein